MAPPIHACRELVRRPVPVRVIHGAGWADDEGAGIVELARVGRLGIRVSVVGMGVEDAGETAAHFVHAYCANLEVDVGDVDVRHRLEV